jgi:hypothetical protein
MQSGAILKSVPVFHRGGEARAGGAAFSLSLARGFEPLEPRFCLDRLQSGGYESIKRQNDRLEKHMNPSHKNHFTTTALGLLALALAAVGCSSTPKPKVRAWNIKITKVTPASLEVDLVGVNKSEDPYWRSVSVNKYWQPNSALRREAENRAKNSRFEGSKEYELKQDDPVWGKWFGYGAYELMVIANLPGSFSDTGSDPRRLFLPLDKNQWPEAKEQTLELEVSESQIRVLTPQKP